MAKLVPCFLLLLDVILLPVIVYSDSNITTYTCLCSMSCDEYSNEALSLPGSGINDCQVEQVMPVPAIPQLDICFCDNTTNTECLSQASAKLFPGQHYKVCLKTTASARDKTRTHYIPQFNNSWQLDSTEQIYTHNDTQVYFTVASSDIGYSGLLQFLVPNTAAVANLSIHLEECPLGFTLDEADQTCKCSAFLTNFTVNCDLKNGALLYGITKWVGVVDGQLAYSSKCIIGYCHNTRERSDFVNNTHRHDQVCVADRDGVVCGACKEGFSVVFGDSICKRCSNWYLFTIFLYIIIGILLVTGVFVFDLTVSRGTVIGPVFIGNLFLAVNYIGYSEIDDVGKPLFLWISWLGLALGFPLCFYDKMTVLQKAVIEFIFPGYLIGLVVLVIVLSRYSRTVAKLVSRSSVQALATLQFITFGNLLDSAFKIFQFNTIFLSNGDQKMVWLHDGNVKYFSELHRLSCVLALLILIAIILPYTFLITFGPFLIRWSLVAKLKPFLDAHSGPYKEKYRYWFGARLWAIITVRIVFTLGINQLTLLYLLCALVLTIFIAIEALIKPYKNEILNYLDLGMLLPLALGVTGVIFAPLFSELSAPLRVVEIFNGILGVICFSFFCLILAYHFNDRYQVWTKIKNKVKNKIKKRPKPTHPDLNEPLVTSLVVIERLQNRQVYDHSQYREPILSVLDSPN